MSGKAEHSGQHSVDDENVLMLLDVTASQISSVFVCLGCQRRVRQQKKTVDMTSMSVDPVWDKALLVCLHSIHWIECWKSCRTTFGQQKERIQESTKSSV